MFNYQWIPRILLSFVSLLMITKGTFIETFFRWIYLGFLLDFIFLHYAFLMAFLFIIILFKWVKSPYILAGALLVVYMFLTYILPLLLKPL